MKAIGVILGLVVIAGAVYLFAQQAGEAQDQAEENRAGGGVNVEEKYGVTSTPFGG